MRFLLTQKLKFKEPERIGDFETIVWNSKTHKRDYFKIYDKAKEIIKNYRYKKDKIDSDNFNRQNQNFNLQKLIYFCESNGLIRAELTLRGKKLQDMRCYYLGELNMNVIHAEFRRHTSVFERSTCDVDQIMFESKTLLSIYCMWKQGVNLQITLKKTQRYKHRSDLLKYGVDIFVPYSVAQFVPKTRIIALSAAVMPDWYSMPSVDLKAA
jgi:Phage X family/Phage replication protein CRI